MASHLQLDALSPAVDVLIKDLPVSESCEQSLGVLKRAVEVLRNRGRYRIKVLPWGNGCFFQ